MKYYSFPEEFVWGTSTAAYQIEGAVTEGGRGETIWDRFCRTPGNILHNDTGNVANDHYRCYREDVALMKKLGHKAYRFSVCWSRILPDGTGEVNEEGIRFYTDLVDELIKNDIEPYMTLYHWDLPQALQDRGGWQNEESIDWFTEYCSVMFERFGGRVKYWTTLNEPWCVAFLGNFTGEHAPGYHDISTAIRVSYNIMRAHGAAVRLFRRLNMEGNIGISLNISKYIPASDKPEDMGAAARMDGYNNRWFLDAVFWGAFPSDMVEYYQSIGAILPDLSDQASMSEPIDFLGINYYCPQMYRYDEKEWPFKAEAVHMNLPHTDCSWAIQPEGLRDVLVRIWKDYKPKRLYMSENGASYNDVVDLDGKVNDSARIDYLKRHLIAVHQAMELGANISGYFVWSLYDNFEWAYGRYNRFGIVFHDFNTLERIPKQSAYWYKNVIENNGVEV